jgi:hypothetical protein
MSHLKLEKPAPSTELVPVAPLLAFVQGLRNDIATIKGRTPDASTVTVEKLADDLQRVIDEARRSDVWVTTKILHALTGRPISTITRICRDEGERAGAHWVKGAWSIHFPTWQAFWAGLVA